LKNKLISSIIRQITNEIIFAKGEDMASAKARHILVATKEECENLKAQILKGSDFAEVAKKHSKCPSGKQGGYLGEFCQGEMVREFDLVVFKEAIGKVHGPVKTQFGYHLIEIMERED
jgi:peptidyl-prolyl cis-trans isomerase C